MFRNGYLDQGKPRRKKMKFGYGGLTVNLISLRWILTSMAKYCKTSIKKEEEMPFGQTRNQEVNVYEVNRGRIERSIELQTIPPDNRRR
jgi:hypothetical protein